MTSNLGVDDLENRVQRLVSGMQRWQYKGAIYLKLSRTLLIRVNYCQSLVVGAQDFNELDSFSTYIHTTHDIPPRHLRFTKIS
jgi:hypothetical protein